MTRDLSVMQPAYAFIRDLLSMILAYVRELLMYVNLCIGNPCVFLMYVTDVSATRVHLLKMSKKHEF